MNVVGITGGIEHGKTTFAQYLAKQADSHQNYESSQVIIEVANGLRQASRQHPKAEDTPGINGWLASLPGILASSVHLKPSLDDIKLQVERLRAHPEYYTKLFEYLRLMAKQPELQTATITAANSEDFRTLLQWLGGYLAKTVDDGIWFDEIIRRIKAAPPVSLVTVGGVRFPADADRVTAAGGIIIEIKRPTIAERDIHDLTERERSLIKPDTLVWNDGSLPDLEHCAQLLYGDLRDHKLATKYHARQD